MTKTSITFFGRLCPKKGIPTCRSWLPILSRTLPQKVGGFDVRWLRVFRFLRLRVRRWKSRCQKEKNVWQINSCEWPNCLQLLFCRLGLVGNLLVYDVPGHFWPFFFARNRIVLWMRMYIFLLSHHFPRYLSMFFMPFVKNKSVPGPPLGSF